MLCQDLSIHPPAPTHSGRANVWLAGLGLLLSAGHAPAATVSAPMEMSAQVPVDAGGAGRTLDKALTGTNASTGDRTLDTALELQRADLAGRGRLAAEPPALARPAAGARPDLAGQRGQTAQPAVPTLALPQLPVGSVMPSALSIGGLSANDAGAAAARTSGRDAHQPWSNTQGSADRSAGGGMAGQVDQSGARRLAAAVHAFLQEQRNWLLGGLALALVAAGLTQLVRKGARHRTGQSAIEQAAQHAGRHTSRRRSSSRRG